MPKPKEITKKLRAVDLSKPYIKAGFNQSELARKRGVSRATINEQVHRQPTIDSLKAFLDSPKLKTKLQTVAEEGLDANKTISAVAFPGKEREADSKSLDFIDVPDHGARHKFWHDLMIATGGLKATENKISAALFVGSDLKGFLQGIKDKKVRSDAKPD